MDHREAALAPSAHDACTGAGAASHTLCYGIDSDGTRQRPEIHVSVTPRLRRMQVCDTEFKSGSTALSKRFHMLLFCSPL